MRTPGIQGAGLGYPVATSGRTLGNVPGVSIVGALGAGPPVIFRGLGQTSKQKAFAGLLTAAALTAITGSAYAMTRESSRPILYPGLLLGGMTLGSGLLAMLLTNGDEAA
jgi:hypothetical protein